MHARLLGSVGMQPADTTNVVAKAIADDDERDQVYAAA